MGLEVKAKQSDNVAMKRKFASVSVFTFLRNMVSLGAVGQVHYTYLWHLEQPIYWPAPDASLKRYPRAWEGILAKRNGALHPTMEVFAQGKGVGPWEVVQMNRRAFPKENVMNDPEFDTSIMPLEIADLYYTRLSGLRDCLIDWFVEAIDTRGNVARSPIQHLFIGSGGEMSKVWTPWYSDCDDPITILWPEGALECAGFWLVMRSRRPRCAMATKSESW